jgi:hypothetical protein
MEKNFSNNNTSQCLFAFQPFYFAPQGGFRGFSPPGPRPSEAAPEAHSDPSQWKKLPEVFHTDLSSPAFAKPGVR